MLSNTSLSLDQLIFHLVYLSHIWSLMWISSAFDIVLALYIALHVPPSREPHSRTVMDTCIRVHSRSCWSFLARKSYITCVSFPAGDSSFSPASSLFHFLSFPSSQFYLVILSFRPPCHLARASGHDAGVGKVVYCVCIEHLVNDDTGFLSYF